MRGDPAFSTNAEKGIRVPRLATSASPAVHPVACTQCDGRRGGFQFPFCGSSLPDVVAPGSDPAQAWARYHEDATRLTRVQLAEAWSGLYPEQLLPLHAEPHVAVHRAGHPCPCSHTQTRMVGVESLACRALRVERAVRSSQQRVPYRQMCLCARMSHKAASGIETGPQSAIVGRSLGHMPFLTILWWGSDPHLGSSISSAVEGLLSAGSGDLPLTDTIGGGGQG